MTVYLAHFTTTNFLATQISLFQIQIVLKGWFVYQFSGSIENLFVLTFYLSSVWALCCCLRHYYVSFSLIWSVRSLKLLSVFVFLGRGSDFGGEWTQLPEHLSRWGRADLEEFATHADDHKGRGPTASCSHCGGWDQMDPQRSDRWELGQQQ